MQGSSDDRSATLETLMRDVLGRLDRLERGREAEPVGPSPAASRPQPSPPVRLPAPPARTPAPPREPLRDLRVTLRAYRDYVLLAPGHAPPYRLLYGGPAVPPQYDFAQQPERHPSLLQAAPALAGLALPAGGFLALRRRT